MPAKSKRTRPTAPTAPASGAGKRQKKGMGVCSLPTLAHSHSFTSSSAASAPGLYDCRGILLVAVPGHESIDAEVFGHEYTLQVQPGGETLTITRWVRSDGREDRCRIFVEDRANKIDWLKRDMKALQADIVAKLADFEDEYLEIEPSEIGKGGIADLLALRGKHKAELKELESRANVMVPFEQTTKSESVVLELDKIVSVDFFDEPVVYLQCPLVAALVLVSEVVESKQVSLSAWQAENIVGTYVATLGAGRGAGDGQLDRPGDVVVSGDLLYVSETRNHRVSVFDRRYGAFVRMFGNGHYGSDGVYLLYPHGLAVTNGRVFVADGGQDCVSVFTEAGSFVRIIGRGVGSGDGQLRIPMDVAVSGEYLFVAEYGNDRISMFSLDGSFIRSFGSHGVGPGQLHHSRGLCVSNDLVFVADRDNHRVSVFRHNGEFLRVFGSRGSGNGQFDYPSGVCMSGERLFVSDYNNHRVSVHQLDGTFVRSFGSEGIENGQFDDPMGVAVEGDRLYVVDSGNNRVQELS
jgi:hypothetical protein